MVLVVDTLHPLQIQRFREMTFQEKYRISQSLFRMAREARVRAYQRGNPTWNHSQCLAAVAQEFTRGRP